MTIPDKPAILEAARRIGSPFDAPDIGAELGIDDYGEWCKILGRMNAMVSDGVLIKNGDRITVRKRQRRQQHSWAFHQQRSFVEYKSKLQGVPCRAIDPRNSSRECPECHHIDKANRRSRDWFECRQCGHAGPADNIAGRNLSARASVMTPYAGQDGAMPHGGLASIAL